MLSSWHNYTILRKHFTAFFTLFEMETAISASVKCCVIMLENGRMEKGLVFFGFFTSNFLATVRMYTKVFKTYSSLRRTENPIFIKTLHSTSCSYQLLLLQKAGNLIGLFSLCSWQTLCVMACLAEQGSAIYILFVI